MKVIKNGNGGWKLDQSKHNVYRFKCVNCGSILQARDDDPALEYTGENRREFHFVCPVCGERHLMRVCWYSCEVLDSEDEEA
jgi:DNA-directed RNA polymerase subunit RPC12/RpoP